MNCYIKTSAAAFLGVFTMPYLMLINGERLAFTNSVWSVFAFIALFFLFHNIFEKSFEGKKSGWILPGIVGFLFSFFLVIGTQLEIKGSINLSDACLWLALLVWGVLGSLIIRYTWDVLILKKGICKKELSADYKFEWKSFFVTAGIIFVCYFIVFLAVYPGFFVYDAQDEVMQVITRKFSTHHPLIHVLLLGGFSQLGYKLFDSYNTGIAMYSVLQMLFASGVLAWCVELLKKRGVRKSVRILITLYFGLFPTVVMGALCTSKDAIFSGLVLMAVLYLQEMCKDFDGFFAAKKKVMVLFMAAVGMALFRHNGYYALVVFFVLLLISYRKEWKRILVIAVCVVVAYSGINNGLRWVLHAKEGGKQEMLTVPIMQMARTYVYEKDNLPQEEKDVLIKFIHEKYLMIYTPKLSDRVKYHFENEKYRENSDEFWKLWAKWGMRYPVIYINAWLMTSYGFWYPDAVIDVYRGNAVFTYTYEDSSYFGYETEQPGVRESKIPLLDKLYRKISLEIFQQKIPVVSMLFSPGFMLWVAVFFVGFLAYEKRWNSVMPFLLVALIWLTFLLGPTFLPRYVFYLWTVVPVLICECFIVEKNRETKNVATD